MQRTILHVVLTRELRAARRAIEAYPDDASVWTLPTGLPNAAGTLVLHVCGNLRHFVGGVLGHTGYVRNRDAEFARRDVPRAELLAELDAAIADVERTFGSMRDDVLDTVYPLEVSGGRRVNTGDWLVHLASHLAYHLGQIDSHRRIVTGDSHGLDAVSTREVPELSPGAKPVA